MTIKTKEDFDGKFIKMAKIDDKFFYKTLKKDVFYKVIEKCRRFDKDSKFIGCYPIDDNPYIYIHSKEGLGNYCSFEKDSNLQEISIEQFLEE